MQSQGQASEGDGNKCGFCGKSREEVRTLLVSGGSSICDECAVTALDTISRQRGHWNMRLGFLAFRAVASLGRLLGLGTRREKGTKADSA